MHQGEAGGPMIRLLNDTQKVIIDNICQFDQYRAYETY